MISTSSIPKRAWYPSGPRIGGSVDTATVGAPISRTAGHPNPSRYRITLVKEVGGFLIMKINYPDCTNYEGNKILVFHGVTLIDLMYQRDIDPHFFNDPNLKSPIARFAPTDEGWAMAVKLAEMHGRFVPSPGVRPGEGVMEIVKRGVPPAEIPWFGRCVSCKTEVKAARTEVRVEHDQREGGEFGHATCPVCGYGMVLYPKQVSSQGFSDK